MAEIHVNFSMLDDLASKKSQKSRVLLDLKRQLDSHRSSMDWDVKSSSGIEWKLGEISRSMEACVAALSGLSQFVSNASGAYLKCENEIAGIGLTGAVDGGGNGQTGSVEGVGNGQTGISGDIRNDLQPVWAFSGFTHGYVAPDGWDVAAVTFAGWNDGLHGKITGHYEENLVKKNLADLLAKMDERKSPYKIPEDISKSMELFKKTGEWDAAFLQKYAKIIGGIGDADKLIKQIGGANELISYGNTAADMMAYLLADYSRSIESLELLRQGNISDPILNRVIDGLIVEYSDKVAGSLGNTVAYAVEKGFDKSFDEVVKALPGGAVVNLVGLSTDLVSSATGIDHIAETLETNATATIYSINFQMEYQEIMKKISSGSYTPTDLNSAEKLFDLTKASYIQQYETGLELAHTEEQKMQISTGLDALNSMHFRKSDSTAVIQGNGGGGW